MSPSILIPIVTFFIGYFFGFYFGKIDSFINLLKEKHNVNNKEVQPLSFLQKIKEEKTNQINIDERKFVTKVDTSFEKNFQKLGKEVMSNDNIDSSVSKLAKLKKK
jgi:uncharacterized protein YacL